MFFLSGRCCGFIFHELSSAILSTHGSKYFHFIHSFPLICILRRASRKPRLLPPRTWSHSRWSMYLWQSRCCCMFYCSSQWERHYSSPNDLAILKQPYKTQSNEASVAAVNPTLLCKGWHNYTLLALRKCWQALVQ